MADLGFQINTNELPEAKAMDFNPLPAGKYNTIITNTRLDPTNETKKAMAEAGVDSYDVFRKTNPRASGFLVLEMDVQDGPCAGRKIFHNLNLINDSEEAANIAAGQLKQILEAFKIKTFSGKSEELHNKLLVVDVTVRPAKPYKDKNTGEQKPGFPSNNCVKFSAPASVATAAPQSTATAGKGPWAR